MDSETGRCAILFPHGVLFRDTEAELRRKLIEADLVECVLGLGPGLFYNSAMEQEPCADSLHGRRCSWAFVR